ANDWNGLRTIASAQSRGEAPSVELDVSPGSHIVEKVVSPLKVRYPFVALLQPQGELVVLLLLAFEPALLWHVGQLVRLAYGRRLEGGNPEGRAPGGTQQLGLPDDPELAAVFGEALV